jgi:gliding motility-associated protein GldM
MINMMYLVLTALLAMNVSKEVINAFKNVDASINKTIKVLNDKNASTYSALEDAAADPQTKEKAAIWKPIAGEIAKLSNSLIGEIDKYKTDIKKASKMEMKDGEEYYKYDDLNANTRIMIKEKKGHEIYKKVQQYKVDVINVLKTASVPENMKAQHMAAVANFEKSLPCELKVPPKSSTGKLYKQNAEDWTTSSFYMTPSVAGITVLSKIQNDVKSSEGMLSDYCLNQIGKVKIIYDKFAAVASANTTYCMPGEEIEITAGVGAFNDQAKPSISIGGPVPLNVDGVAVKKITAGGPGEYPVNVTISFTTPAGEKKSVNKTIKYTVGQPSGAALMLDKMNVFYIGLDNPVTVSSGTGDEKTKLSASGGGVTLSKSAPGKYIVRATTIGESTITISDGRQNTPFKFRVKRVPDPLATIGGTFKGGKIPKGTLQVQQGVKAILENFDFDAKFTVKSFEFTYVPKNGDPRESRIVGERFNADWSSAVNACKPNDVFLIENVKVIGPDGTERKIPGLSAQIKM